MSMIDDTPKWTFPEVRYLVEDKIGEYNISYQLRMHESKINELENVLAQKQIELEKMNDELVKAKKIIEEMQDQKIKTINGIKASLHKIHESVSVEAIHVIKSVSKRIILRELNDDEQTLKTMFENILLKLKADESTQIEVSELDFQTLSTANFSHPYKIVMNSNLTPGDLIVSSPSGNVLFKLDDAINTVLGQ